MPLHISIKALLFHPLRDLAAQVNYLSEKVLDNLERQSVLLGNTNKKDDNLARYIRFYLAMVLDTSYANVCRYNNYHFKRKQKTQQIFGLYTDNCFSTVGRRAHILFCR